MQKKIILADDNRTFLMYVGLLLRRFGFQVMHATNGLEALRIAKTTPADLFILDVHMDTVDGISSLRHIKADSDLAHIPVIMISTDMNPDTISLCRGLGCFDYLPKPIKVDMLHDAVQRSFFSQTRPNRRHLRTTFNQKVSLTCKDKTYELSAETLSEGGIYIRSEKPLPVGSDVEVLLHLNGTESRTFKGKVIYAKEQFGDFSNVSPGMGIQFQELSDQEYRQMNNFLKTLVAGDIFDEQQGTYLEP